MGFITMVSPPFGGNMFKTVPATLGTSKKMELLMLYDYF